MLPFEESLAVLKKNDDEMKSRDIVGVGGKLYDITYYSKHHPGGDIIKKFINREATIVFNAFNHKQEYLDRIKFVGVYEQQIDPIDKDFIELGLKFEKMGFKEGIKSWFLVKFLIIFLLIGSVFYLFSQFDHIIFHLLGSFLLFFTWQQSGFLMHDAMHSHMFHNAKYDEIVGVFFSITILGVNGLWWKEDHNTHHALTGVIDIAEKWMDPQLLEGIWVQNSKMFPFFNQDFHYYLIKVQAFIFVPINVIAGRYAIMIDSFFVGEYKKARSVLVFIPWIAHWAWVIYLFSYLPTWQRIMFIYFITGCLQGILHLQLLVSHYSKLMLFREEYDKASWFKYNVDNNLNIHCSKWFDWFHGGLNFHIEHHLFPTFPRNYYRQMSPYVQELCKKHDIPYDSFGWLEVVWKTIKHLHATSKEYIKAQDEYTSIKL